MRGLSVRLTPTGRAEVITPPDQTPILDVVENARTVLSLTPRRLDEVSDEEMEAARSLLAALQVFVTACERWTAPVTTVASRVPGPTSGGAA
jgi:hypothetical protein